MDWETARSTGNIHGSARLIKVGGRWYFKDFEFMTFPWLLVAIPCSFSVTPVTLFMYLYFRAKKRQPVSA